MCRWSVFGDPAVCLSRRSQLVGPQARLLDVNNKSDGVRGDGACARGDRNWTTEHAADNGTLLPGDERSSALHRRRRLAALSCKVAVVRGMAAAAAVSFAIVSGGGAVVAASPGGGAAERLALASVRDVRFGQSVLVPSKNDRARANLKFVGRAGDGLILNGDWSHVSRCDFSTLHASGRVVRRSAVGIWMFPRTGTYTLHFDDRCPNNVSPGGGTYQEDQLLVLKRLVLHRRDIGQRVPTRSTRSTVHAGLVTLRTRADALAVESRGLPTVEHAGRLLRGRFVPDEDARATRTCYTTHLGIGHPMRNALDRRCAGGKVRRGTSYVVFSEKPTRLNPYRTIRTKLDAARPVERQGWGPTRLSFVGRAGDVIRVDAPALKNLNWYNAVLRGADGRRIDVLTNTSDYSAIKSPWPLPYSGRFFLDLGSAPRGTEVVRATIRSVDTVSMKVGAPATMTARDGRWVVALLATPGVRDGQLTVSNVDTASPAGWKAAVLGISRDTESVTDALTAPGVSEIFSYGQGVLLTPGDGNEPTSITVELDVAPR